MNSSRIVVGTSPPGDNEHHAVAATPSVDWGRSIAAMVKLVVAVRWPMCSPGLSQTCHEKLSRLRSSNGVRAFAFPVLEHRQLPWRCRRHGISERVMEFASSRHRGR
jgi:hypothetical protein